MVESVVHGPQASLPVHYFIIFPDTPEKPSSFSHISLSPNETSLITLIGACIHTQKCIFRCGPAIYISILKCSITVLGISHLPTSQFMYSYVWRVIVAPNVVAVFT